ncbi:hypothetical protein FGO68_gene15406 [Halteria grandinella]|uniref:Uncharacterized protein n=1 Tax=Halteria grandinella TaxID=5974 RepID=A0A8J8P6G8_HALGN|nr:hypothetical protein FGO68_gene15406 [Halteria grandinella]
MEAKLNPKNEKYEYLLSKVLIPFRVVATTRNTIQLLLNLTEIQDVLGYRISNTQVLSQNTNIIQFYDEVQIKVNQTLMSGTSEVQPTSSKAIFYVQKATITLGQIPPQIDEGKIFQQLQTLIRICNFGHSYYLISLNIFIHLSPSKFGDSNLLVSTIMNQSFIDLLQSLSFGKFLRASHKQLFFHQYRQPYLAWQMIQTEHFQIQHNLTYFQQLKSRISSFNLMISRIQPLMTIFKSLATSKRMHLEIWVPRFYI